MKTWIFQGNPDKFGIDEYLIKAKEIYWSVTIPKYQTQITIGDEVYIWRAKGSQNAISGVVSFGVINEECNPREKLKNKLNLYDNLWTEPFSEASNIKAGVLVKEIRLSPLDGMLTADELKKDPVLSKMQILTSRVGSNFLLNDVQSQIIKNYWDGLNIKIDEQEDDFFSSKEGRIKLRLHKIRERNPQIKRKAIEVFKRKNNDIFCEICRFSFEEKYGTLGKDFIEVHHLKPISKYKDNEETTIENLKLVCSNCHRMIHRGEPFSMFYDLKSMFSLSSDPWLWLSTD